MGGDLPGGELTVAHEQTFQHAGGVFGNVRADQYDDPTPCPDWAVRDLLSHTIGVVASLGAAASGTAPTEFALGTTRPGSSRPTDAGPTEQVVAFLGRQP